MADWAAAQDYNGVTICPTSPEALPELAYHQTGAPASTAWPAANRAIFVPFLVYQPLVVVKMMISNGSTAAGNVDVGVYDDQGNLLVSSGSTAQSGTGALQTFDITDTLLLPGLYYMAQAASTTSHTNVAWAPLALPGCMGIAQMASALPLPATATFATATSSYVPGIAVTTRTLI